MRFLIFRVLAALLAGSCAARVQAAAGEDPRAQSMMQAIEGRLLADRVAQAQARAQLEAAVIELGTWRRIGPFRDRRPLLNWMDNVASSFETRYEAESDARANGNAPLLDKAYPAPNFPATPEAVRHWVRHPDWIDGYYQELPRGPAPSAGETQYLYRTITVAEPTTAAIDFIIRAPGSDRRRRERGMGPGAARVAMCGGSMAGRFSGGKAMATCRRKRRCS
jgi:hypothetical protein